eukprot:3443025-Rhodomonas_salina.3
MMRDTTALLARTSCAGKAETGCGVAGGHQGGDGTVQPHPALPCPLPIPLSQPFAMLCPVLT